MYMRGESAKYWWFRIFGGYGLHIRWISKAYVPLFSERYGYERVLKIGRLWIKVLKPIRDEP